MHSTPELPSQEAFSLAFLSQGLTELGRQGPEPSEVHWAVILHHPVLASEQLTMTGMCHKA